jgi:hypothetical protein
MTDALDVELYDPELIAEIRLVADLMVAASDSEGPLAQGLVDRILCIPAGV